LDVDEEGKKFFVFSPSVELVFRGLQEGLLHYSNTNTIINYGEKWSDENKFIRSCSVWEKKANKKNPVRETRRVREEKITQGRKYLRAPIIENRECDSLRLMKNIFTLTNDSG
jgi:hypothetical protein